MMNNPIDPARSATMRAVKSKDTAPEMIVRRLLHSLGYRYRLHRKDLPGCPDLVFPARRKIIFVHGCFWHGHDCARGRREPKTNAAYWSNKITRNKMRHSHAIAELTSASWKVLTIWECELKNEMSLQRRAEKFLGIRTKASS
jgi:DNA mismatch endonuclease, patch repair protein